MGAIKRHIGTSVVLVLLTICLGLAILYSKRGDTFGNIKVFHQEETRLNGLQAIEMLEREKEQEISVNYTLWGELQNQTVSYSELYRSTSVSAMVINGESRLLLKSAWNLLEQDKYGCLIDAQTAYKLFGDTNVVGQTIEYEKKEYVIRGIVQKLENVLIIQSTSETKEVMNYISIEIGNNQRTEEVINNFQRRHSISGNIMDFNVYNTWATILVAILPIILFLSILVKFIKIIYNTSKKVPIHAVCYSFIALIFFVTMFGVLRIKIQYPQAFIPSKWSDFGFWSNLYTEQINKVLAVLKGKKSLPELNLIIPFLETLKYAVLSYILYFILNKYMIIKKAEELVLYLVSTFVGSFLVIYLSELNGNLISGNRQVWFLIPIYLSGRYILAKIYDYEKSILFCCSNDGNCGMIKASSK